MTVLARTPESWSTFMLMVMGIPALFLLTLSVMALFRKFSKQARYRSQGMVEDARKLGLTWTDAAPMSTTFLSGGVFSHTDRAMPLEHKTNPRTSMRKVTVYPATDIAYRMTGFPTFALMFTPDPAVASEHASSKRAFVTMTCFGSNVPAMTITPGGSSKLTESISFNESYGVDVPPGDENAARALLIPLVMERIEALHGSRRVWTEPDGWLCIEWEHPPSSPERKLGTYLSRIDACERIAHAIPTMHTQTSAPSLRRTVERVFSWTSAGPGVSR